MGRASHRRGGRRRRHHAPGGYAAPGRARPEHPGPEWRRGGDTAGGVVGRIPWWTGARARWSFSIYETLERRRGPRIKAQGIYRKGLLSRTQGPGKPGPRLTLISRPGRLLFFDRRHLLTQGELLDLTPRPAPGQLMMAADSGALNVTLLATINLCPGTSSPARIRHGMQRSPRGGQLQLTHFVGLITRSA